MKNSDLVERAEHPVKSGRPKRSAAMQADFNKFPPGTGGPTMAAAIDMYQLPDIDTNDAGQVEKRVTEYFAICGKYDMKPGFAGLGFALGLSRPTMWNIVHDMTNKPQDVVAIIKRAHNMLGTLMEDQMQTGKINPVSGIFLMKNNFGYRDQQEIMVTPANPLGDIQDQKALEERYKEDMIIDSDFREV